MCILYKLYLVLTVSHPSDKNLSISFILSMPVQELVKVNVWAFLPLNSYNDTPLTITLSRIMHNVYKTTNATIVMFNFLCLVIVTPPLATDWVIKYNNDQ